MEHLIKSISDKTGISEENATTAVHTVLSFIKDKLPPGIGEHLDSFIKDDHLAGSNDNGGLVGSLKDKLGGLFGK